MYTSHLVKFPRACHNSPTLTEEQLAQLVRQRSLAQHAGAWSQVQVLDDYVSKVGKLHYTDDDMLFGDHEGDDPYEPPEDEADEEELVPVVPRLLPPTRFMFDEATCPAWQAHMTQQVLPALADAPGSGMYGYVVHVSSPFLPACEVGCACQKGNQGCHFIVLNNQPCTVYGIQVPMQTPLYMCAASCVIVGPANNSLSPPVYLDDCNKLQYVVDKRWVRIAHKHNKTVHYERFGVGDMRHLWEAVAPSNCVSEGVFVDHVVGTHMKEPFVREAVYRFVQQHPHLEEEALSTRILSNPIMGKTIVVKIGNKTLRAASPTT